ncbi:hypothetical protein [Candidatus Poriferisodalis sp.]|uniref:hypothetical protein n=1 Tax=Candidatus Poriferisodalis sp. TaxID=3101277 RepID=UPI003B022B78
MRIAEITMEHLLGAGADLGDEDLRACQNRLLAAQAVLASGDVVTGADPSVTTAARRS